MRTINCLIITVLALALSAVHLRGTAAVPFQLDRQTEKAVIEGNNQFAVNIYNNLRSNAGNLFFSPYSISSALAMTYAGARGETQTQIAATLRFPQDPKAVHSTFAALGREFNGGSVERGYQLSVANALWGEKSVDFLGDFLNTIKTSYGGGVNELDFIKSPESSRQTINAWVEKHTQGKIRDLLQAGSITTSDRLVLTNAIYFKGDWASQFRKELTSPAPFSTLDGKPMNVALMHQTSTFGYLDRDSYQILEMPYVGNDLSMVILLPKTPGGLGELEGALNAETLSTSGLVSRKVDVFVPKFKLEQSFELNSILSDLGMSGAFSDLADFSGMNGKKDLHLSLVVHKAYVDVDEKGTEAAAATGAVARTTSLRTQEEEIPVFRADHPFVFVIRDRRSGSILFVGRIVNPA